MTREEDGHDARATYAVLTANGRTLIRNAKATMEAFSESLLRSLKERDRAVLARLADQ